MNEFAIVFLLISAAGMFALPRRWAPLPLLMGGCYMTNAQQFMVGPFHFTVLRLLILVGFVRAMARNERLPGGVKGLDWILLTWGAWALFTSVFHKLPIDTLVFRMGLTYNALGIYFLIRIFCQTPRDIIQLITLTAFVLVPVALEMVYEKISGRNLFAFFGGVPDLVEVRDGKLRAQGPFGHSILAGTVGAVCAPLMIGIWRQQALAAKVGVVACLIMVVASKSSGPLMSLTAGFFALILWRWRHLTKQMRIGGIVGYVLLDIYMKDPAYYLIARIDLTGSSTGYHRARLIQVAIEHLGEWGLAGTDYTRHWMPYGVSYSPDHIDITNHYLYYGIWGGLMLMAVFIIALWVGFRYIGESLRWNNNHFFTDQFLIWSIGSALFTQAVTCISVTYFEQSVMFIYLNLAIIGSLHAALSKGLYDRRSLSGSSMDGSAEQIKV